MITVIGILVGAIIVALIWMCVYFNQEIQSIRSEMRLRTGSPAPYRQTTYADYAKDIHNDKSWERKYKSLLAEYEKLEERIIKKHPDLLEELEYDADDD